MGQHLLRHQPHLDGASLIELRLVALLLLLDAALVLGLGAQSRLVDCVAREWCATIERSWISSGVQWRPGARVMHGQHARDAAVHPQRGRQHRAHPRGHVLQAGEARIGEQVRRAQSLTLGEQVPHHAHRHRRLPRARILEAARAACARSSWAPRSSPGPSSLDRAFVCRDHGRRLSTIQSRIGWSWVVEMITPARARRGTRERGLEARGGSWGRVILMPSVMELSRSGGSRATRFYGPCASAKA